MSKRGHDHYSRRDIAMRRLRAADDALWQDEQDAIGDLLDDRDGDHDGFVSHWDRRVPQHPEGNGNEEV